jgi:hypothetical protein
MTITSNSSTRHGSTLFAAIAVLAFAPVAVFAQAGPGGAPPGAPAAGGPPGGPPIGGRLDQTMVLPVPKLPPGAPQPSPDPRNFEGTWHGDRLVGQIGHDILGDPIPFNARGRKVMNRRIHAQESGTPFINASSRCMPVGLPWQFMADPINIKQTPDWLELTFFHQHSRIYIFLNPKIAFTAPEYEGVSIGHWDGDTLVVETRKLKLGLWLDTVGTPASKDAKLTTRLRKVKFGDQWHLEAVYTLDDPTYYTRPWSWAGYYYWRPDVAKVLEYNCEEQMGDRSANRNAGLVPEPTD